MNVFADIVSFIQPIAFVMENVPEFLSNRYWKYFYAAKIDMNRKDTLLKKIYTMLHLLGFHKKDSDLL